MRSSHYPNGRLPLVRLAAGIAVSVGLLVDCSEPSSNAAQAHLSAKHVVYVSAVDAPEDGRNRLDFEHFQRAISRARAPKAVSVDLQFAEAIGPGTGPAVALMRSVVATHPDAIIASSYVVAEAAKGATDSIPILFMSHEDPIELGHVLSIAHPGVNRTGSTYYLPILAKSIEVLTQAYPRAAHVGIVVDNTLMHSKGFAKELKAARERNGISIHTFLASTVDELRTMLASPLGKTMDAWYVPTTDVIWSGRSKVMSMMAQAHVPVLYDRTAQVQLPGSMSYEAHLRDPLAIWADQLMLILSGVDPKTIPVEQPSIFELAVALPKSSADSDLAPTSAIVLRANVIVGND